MKKGRKTVTKLVDVPGGTYGSDDDDAWSSEARSESGNATTKAPVVATTVNSDGDNLSFETTADEGTATSVVSARHLSMTSLDESNLDLETTGSNTAAPVGSSSGAGHSSVSVVGGHFVADGDNVEVDGTQSNYGPATNAVTVTGASLTAGGENVECSVTASRTGGSGGATSKATVSGSTLVADDDAVDSVVTADHGAAPATGSVAVSRSSSSSGSDDVENHAFSAQQSGSHGNALLNTTLSHDIAQSGDEGLDLEAYSAYGGAATSNPTIVDSTLSTDDDIINDDVQSARTAGQGAATARPTVTSSTLTSDGRSLDDTARAEHGNSAANGSFAISASRLTATDEAAVSVEAEGSGSGVSTINPTVKSSNVRSPDDDGFDLEADGVGSGDNRVGGSISNSAIRVEGTAVQVSATGNGTGSAAAFTTIFSKDTIVAADDRGVSATVSAYGASGTLAPTITGGSISAPDDNAIQFNSTGFGGAATDVLADSPVISNEQITGDEGVELRAEDDHGAAAPGSVDVGGSISNSSIVSADSGGISATSTCDYCEGGARTNVKVTNTPINADESAGYFAATTTTNTTASASVGGSATSSRHNRWTTVDGEAVEVQVTSAKGNAGDSMSVSGLRLSGSDGGITSLVTASSGAVSYSGSVTGVSISSSPSASSENGITTVLTAGTNASDTGSLSHNAITDLPDSDGIYEVVTAAGGTATEAKRIEDNTIGNVGASGIYVEATWATKPASSTVVTIDHNSITRTGASGVEVHGVKAAITSNRITFAGLDAAARPDGVYADAEPYQGSTTCNVIWSTGVGVEYGANNPTAGAAGHNGDPKTNDNAFRSPTSSVRNVLDLRSANAGAGTTDAQSNFWGGSPRLWAPTNRYDVSPQLTKAPKCTASAGA